jgi:predicted nucleotidyltransferase
LLEMDEERFRYYRLSENEKKLLLEKIRSILSRYGIELAIVFGSFVWEEVFRDIDIAIYSHDLNLDKVLVIGAEIEYELGIPVDVAPLHELNPVLRLKILRKGLVVIEKPGMYEYMFMRTCDELETMRLALREPLSTCY